MVLKIVIWLYNSYAYISGVDKLLQQVFNAHLFVL
jgi:hypothetical protein